MIYEAEIRLSQCLKESLDESLCCDHLEASTKSELRKLLDHGSGEETVVPVRLAKLAHTALAAKEREKPFYLHEMLDGCELHFPEYQRPPRNPELETRIQRLKAEAANREYRRMTRNVDSLKVYPEGNFGAELKGLNRQIIAVINFIITVGGAFAFGYKGSEAAMENPNVAIQLTFGLVLGTIVFFADLYFLVKKAM